MSIGRFHCKPIDQPPQTPHSTIPFANDDDGGGGGDGDNDNFNRRWKWQSLAKPVNGIEKIKGVATCAHNTNTQGKKTSHTQASTALTHSQRRHVDFCCHLSRVAFNEIDLPINNKCDNIIFTYFSTESCQYQCDSWVFEWNYTISKQCHNDEDTHFCFFCHFDSCFICNNCTDSVASELEWASLCVCVCTHTTPIEESVIKLRHGAKTSAPFAQFTLIERKEWEREEKKATQIKCECLKCFDFERSTRLINFLMWSNHLYIVSNVCSPVSYFDQYTSNNCGKRNEINESHRSDINSYTISYSSSGASYLYVHMTLTSHEHHLV